MDTNGFMAKNPLFTRDDWMSFRKAHAEASESSAEQLLEYYVGKRRLVRVRRELYAVVTPGVEANRADVDPFVVCMKAAADAVVAYHAALEFHGHAYSLHNEFQAGGLRNQTYTGCAICRWKVAVALRIVTRRPGQHRNRYQLYISPAAVAADCQIVRIHRRPAGGGFAAHGYSRTGGG